MTFVPETIAGPISYTARRILDYIADNQEECFDYYNSTWGALIDHTLEPIDSRSMFVARPIDIAEVHSRALFAIPASITDEFENYYRERQTVLLYYQTGNVGFEGVSDVAHAQQAPGLEIIGFYNLAFMAMLKKLSRKDTCFLHFAENWPTIEKPGFTLQYKQDTLQAANIGAKAELGSQMIIQVDILVHS